MKRLLGLAVALLVSIVGCSAGSSLDFGPSQLSSEVEVHAWQNPAFYFNEDGCTGSTLGFLSSEACAKLQECNKLGFDKWVTWDQTPLVDLASTGRERFIDQDLALHEQLDKPISVNFEDQSFEEVIGQLAQGQVNITVIWNDVEMYGIGRDYPVTLRLPSAITFRAALEQILELVGGSEVELGYVVANGTIKIATKDLLDRNVITDVYDIRDLLTGGGNDREDRIIQLLDLIRNTIEPNSWRANGGLAASIEEINGQLVVTQTASAHNAVDDLLSKLRDNYTTPAVSFSTSWRPVQTPDAAEIECCIVCSDTAECCCTADKKCETSENGRRLDCEDEDGDAGECHCVQGGCSCGPVDPQ